jgi:cardiolipin synthase A/B
LHRNTVWLECHARTSAQMSSMINLTHHPTVTRVGQSGVVRHFLSVIVVAGLVVAMSPTIAPAAAGTPALVIKVEPAAGLGFFDEALSHAQHSIDLSMYELEDITIEHDLTSRAKAGVDVRVLLDSAYDIKDVNEPAASYLSAHHVHVVFAPTSQIFHAKYAVVDGTTLYLGTGNLTAQYYATTRDFWIIDRNASDVKAASTTFGADFSHHVVTPSDGHDLVWSPGSSSALIALIGSAKHTLLIENEEMDSTAVEDALDAAAGRHVDVKVVMTRDSEWASALKRLVSHGVHVRVLSSNQIYIHAKVICADCTGNVGRVFVGSENFSTSSLDYNRELGLITSVSAIVGPVRAAVVADYGIGSASI